MTNHSARYAATPAKRCARCGAPLPAARDRRATVCKACAGKNADAAPAAKVQRRCRRCREPIPVTQDQGICKECRHGGGGNREPVAVSCSAGHTFTVQSRDGADVKCPACRSQRGDINWVTVRRPR